MLFHHLAHRRQFVHHRVVDDLLHAGADRFGDGGRRARRQAGESAFLARAMRVLPLRCCGVRRGIATIFCAARRAASCAASRAQSGVSIFGCGQCGAWRRLCGFVCACACWRCLRMGGFGVLGFLDRVHRDRRAETLAIAAAGVRVRFAGAGVAACCATRRRMLDQPRVRLGHRARRFVGGNAALRRGFGFRFGMALRRPRRGSRRTPTRTRRRSRRDSPRSCSARLAFEFAAGHRGAPPASRRPLRRQARSSPDRCRRRRRSRPCRLPACGSTERLHRGPGLRGPGAARRGLWRRRIYECSSLPPMRFDDFDLCVGATAVDAAARFPVKPLFRMSPGDYLAIRGEKEG